MNKKIHTICTIMIIAAALTIACSDMLIDSDPDTNPVTIFESVWAEFDRYYSFFEIKNIDWQEVYAEYRPLIRQNQDGAELFQVLSSMLALFKDGHVSLYTPHGNFIYSAYWTDYPLNYDKNIVENKYLYNMGKTRNDVITWGRITEDIGYIHISTFSESENQYHKIDGILDELNDIKGLILDVRNNTGGYDRNSEITAAKFADQKRLYAYVQWRSGPGHGDFTPLYEKSVDPANSRNFDKPIALLTNRKCFSSCESFRLAMGVLPNVTVIGDTTGGGSGNPIFRELPNGWVYRIPRWIQYTAEQKHYEGIGLPPDIPVTITDNNIASGVDTIIETAVVTLRSQYTQ